MLNLILGLSAFSLNPTVTAPPLPCTWHELRAAKAKYPVKIAFSLVEQNMEKLKSIALQVSTPGSAMYGQHLSQTAIDAIVAPSNASLKHVVEWLSQATGPTAMITQRREVITLETTAADAAQALHATSGFVHFHNTKTEQRALRLVGDIRLPRDVAPLIQSIYGIHGLPLPPRRSIATAPVRKIGDAPVQAAITPKEIRAAYQVDAAAIGSGSPQNAQAVAEFQGQVRARGAHVFKHE
jgi:tripeptidyl-peptidase-1